MQFFAEAFLTKQELLTAAGLLIVGAFFAVWSTILTSRSRPLIPYRPRRPVPWGTPDLLFVVLLYMIAGVCLVLAAKHYLGAEKIKPPDGWYNPEAENTQHAIMQLMSEGNVWVLLLCGFSAIVVAPLVEEFVFRVLLQGWLETLEARFRRRMPNLRRLPRALLPIVITSFLFGMMHFRVNGPPINQDYLLFMMTGDVVVKLLIFAAVIFVLRWRVGATAADFGWSPRTFVADVRLGLLAFAAIALPLYAMQIGLHFALSESVAADPIPLFFLALVLGALYFRTHRIVPVIVLHASLNATSFLLGLLQLN